VADLKIRVFKGNRADPTTTVSIPGKILKIASGFVPHRAVAALKEQGIDLDELVRLSENPVATGNLVEIDNHEKNERIAISLE
jgi:hypothetical protein